MLLVIPLSELSPALFSVEVVGPFFLLALRFSHTRMKATLVRATINVSSSTLAYIVAQLYFMEV